MAIKFLSAIDHGAYQLPTVDGSNGQVLTTDGNGNVTFQSVTASSNYYLSGASFNTGNGVLTLTVSGATDQTVDLDGRYALSSHVHNYDNYGSWNLKTNGTQRTTVQSGGDLNLVAGSNVSLSYSAGGTVTITSTDTNTDTNDIDYINGASFNTGNGILSLTGVGNAGASVDLDGRYLTSYTETDPIFSASAAAGITATNISNWNTAYGWGDHAAAGYVTSSGNTVIGTDSDIITSGATVVDNIYMTDGVITSHSTRTLTLANLGYTGSATADNYGGWRISDGSATEVIASGDTLIVTGAGATGVSYDAGTNTLEISSSDTNTNNYITGASFSTSNGVLTLTRQGLGDLTVDLDGRFTDNGYADALNQHLRTSDSPSFAGMTINGNLTVTGTTVTDQVEVVSTSNGILFEGSAADAYEGLLLASTLTADRTYTLPNASGTVALTSNIPTVNNATLTVQGTGALGGSGTFTANASSNVTISISHDDTSTLSGAYGGSNNGIVIEDITVDGYGHVTAVGTRDLDSRFDAAGSADAVDQRIDNEVLPAIPTNNNQLTNGAGYITGVPSSFSTNTINIGSKVTLTESSDRADLLYINSNTSSWGGLQIGNTSNEFIFSLMGDGTTGGIYDDQNADWLIQWTENAGVRLYHNAGQKLTTTSTGITITGEIVTTGGNSTNWNTAYSWGDHASAGYITDGNTGWNNTYGFITASSTDTLTNKSGNISQWTNDAGYTTTSGTVTSVTVGTGLDISNGTTTPNITLDLSEFTDMTAAVDTGVDELILLDNGAERRKRFAEIFGSAAYQDTSAFDPAGSAASALADAISHTDDRIDNEVLPTFSGYLTTSGKAADSNLLDGLDSTAFLRSNANDTFTGALTINGYIKGNGQQLILSAGESHSYATGQTAEYIYLNAEQGLEINSETGNWSGGWAARKTAYLRGDQLTLDGETLTKTNIQNFKTAYGWGDHSSAGYLTAHPSITAASSVNNSGRTYIQDITLDSNGHVTAITSATETVTNSDTNYYLNGITRSGNTLTFAVSGATNQTYTFGSNAFNSTTIPTNNNQLTNGAGYITGLGWADLSGDQSEIPVGGFNNDAGYLTAHPNITAASSSNNSGRTYIQDITVDSNGHVTGIATATETVVNTNTTYSAGSGLDLSGTTFSIESDLRDGITKIGKDTSNYIAIDADNNNSIDFYISGVWVARIEADGDLHMKGDVIAFSNIFNP